MSTGLEAWPYNPLEVINRSRNVQINMLLGVPDVDGEWQYNIESDGEGRLYHQRRNDEIWYYTYDSLAFELAEAPQIYEGQ
jgi:hypothetical protein